ncbi:hypothetical protein [Pseudomonas bananamidigenes]|uniref:hypothetical protein n=1 Tax=Pseudomonas bananamidigenes TaxID=2843610 RepID=UPI00159EE368|nr:hypothetical protein [Pseudomonas bananamidigenes]
MAAPLSVEGVDDNDLDGNIPRNILVSGTRIVIPRPADTFPNDQVMVFWNQNSVETTIFDQSYPAGIVDPFIYVELTPQQMAIDGVAYVYYKLWKGGGGNPDDSPLRKLTIDHTPLLTFPEPLAVHATLWGYLNNNTNPPLTSGATLRVRPLNSIALPGDVAWIEWKGYRTLNGSGPEVTEAYGRWDKTLSSTDITNGFNYVVPFQRHISSLIDNDSAVFVAQLFRNGRIIAESAKGLVKIDRVTPGTPGPTGLNAQGETKMAIKFVPKKQRSVRVSAADSGVLADIAINTLTDGYIAKSVLDTGSLTFNFTRTPDELDGDNLDVYFGVKGQALQPYSQTIELGPVADRPAGVIPIPVPSSLFPEERTPAAPTVYELMIELFKGGGGNNEPSNTLEFVIDRTAPFNEKNPPRKVKPTPPPTFDNAPTGAQRVADETWLAANANASFTATVSYPQRRLDDVLHAWLQVGAQRVEVFNNTVPATGVFSFATSMLRQFPNGRINLVFQWEDHAGNLGEESAPVAILTLAQAQPPLVKKAPLVPKTDPNYSTALYLEDFVGGIKAIVENAFIENAETGDEVFVVLEDPADVTNFVEIGPLAWANADLTFDLDYASLAKIFGSASEPMDASIRSVIKRTGTPDAESPSEIISLAFDIVGTPLPNPPDLENADMQLPVVTGASNTPNSLLPTDRDKPGKFKVTLAITDPEITPDQTAKCYLNDQFFADFIPFQDVSEFEVAIPASIIAGLPTPRVKARWTLQKSGIDKNVNKSLSQDVLVGGVPVNLPQPTVRVRNPGVRDYIECFAMTSPTSGYRLGLLIPKDPLLPPGKVIKAHFAAYRDQAGTQLIPGTAADADYTIAAADVPDVAPVGGPAFFKAAQPVRGAVAYGKYWYTTDINGPQSSIPVIKQLDTINNSFEYCDRTAAPSA